MLKEFPDRCHVFIHTISEDGSTYRSSSPTENIFFFKNYYEVAVKFGEMGIFSDDITSVQREIERTTSNTRFAKLYSVKTRGGTRRKTRGKTRRNIL